MSEEDQNEIRTENAEIPAVAEENNSFAEAEKQEDTGSGNAAAPDKPGATSIFTLRNFFSFKGRTTRKEYWRLMPIVLVGYLVFGSLVSDFVSDFVSIIGLVCLYICQYSLLAISVRRLRDTGKKILPFVVVNLGAILVWKPLIVVDIYYLAIIMCRKSADKSAEDVMQEIRSQSLHSQLKNRPAAVKKPVALRSKTTSAASRTIKSKQ